MPDQQVQKLLDSFFQGTIQPEQQELLARWIMEHSDDTELEHLMEKAWISFDPNHKLEESKAAELLRLVMSKSHTHSLLSDGQKNVPEAKHTRVTFMRWFRYAAVLLLMAGTGAYLWTRHPQQKQLAFKPAVNAVKMASGPVGRNGAVLTLADGSSIILDNANNGRLARQGHAEVIKLDAGRLLYQNSGKTAENTAPEYNTISTPRGSQYQIVLPDGSKVWLNAASSLRFPTCFNAADRKVEVTGEAYFEVAKDLAHPFLVKSGKMEIQVLGTSFNLNAYQNEDVIKTTLVQGSIKVLKGNSAVLLKPGQQTQVSNDLNESESILVNHPAGIADIIAWKNGWFYFDDTELAVAMRQVERWYNVEVIIKGDVSKEHIMARISRDVSVEKLLHKLELTGNIHVNMEGGKLVVTR